MKFINLDKILTEKEVTEAENASGITFPSSLRSLFLYHNGGDPDPYVYRSVTLNTVVNETLPLVSNTGRGTALETYRNLVIGKEIVHKNFFPFAVDAGGDYFFVNCDEPTAPVYFFRSDSAFSSAEPLERICESLDEFWSNLQAEEE